MKILFVITSLGMGGAEHVVVNLADELSGLGHEVKIAYLTGQVLVSPKSSDIELIPLGMDGIKSLPLTYFKLIRLNSKFKPDVIHSHMFHSNIITRLLRLAVKVPRLISTAHSTNEGGKLRMLAYRYTDGLADVSTNVSKEAVNEYIRKKASNPHKMIPVPNGIDTKKFFFDTGIRDSIRAQLNVADKKMILCVSSLSEAKDYPNLFSAIALLKETRQDFKVFIAGDGPLKDSLNKIVEELGIDDSVSFLGVRRDIKELMSASDIYAMSSAWEGLPMVILEAMACERFVVATDCGGVRETIGSDGIVVKTKNPKHLYLELDNALNMSDEERSSTGAAARQRIVDNYSLDTNVKSYLNLYA